MGDKLHLRISVLVASNWPEGKTDEAYVKQYIADWLKKIKGVGEIEVLEVTTEDAEDRPTVPAPGS